MRTIMIAYTVVHPCACKCTSHTAGASLLASLERIYDVLLRQGISLKLPARAQSLADVVPSPSVVTEKGGWLVTQLAPQHQGYDLISLISLSL